MPIIDSKYTFLDSYFISLPIIGHRNMGVFNCLLFPLPLLLKACFILVNKIPKLL